MSLTGWGRVPFGTPALRDGRPGGEDGATSLDPATVAPDAAGGAYQRGDGALGARPSRRPISGPPSRSQWPRCPTPPPPLPADVLPGEDLAAAEVAPESPPTTAAADSTTTTTGRQGSGHGGRRQDRRSPLPQDLLPQPPLPPALSPARLGQLEQGVPAALCPAGLPRHRDRVGSSPRRRLHQPQPPGVPPAAVRPGRPGAARPDHFSATCEGHAGTARPGQSGAAGEGLPANVPPVRPGHRDELAVSAAVPPVRHGQRRKLPATVPGVRHDGREARALPAAL